MASQAVSKEDKAAEKAAREAVKAEAIAAGNIKLVSGDKNAKGEYEKYTVEVPFKTLVKDGIRKEDDEDQSDLVEDFTEEVAVNLSGALALCGGDESEVWDMFNQAHNQGRRQLVRQSMINKARGPQRHINQIVKRLVALGFSEEDAQEQAAALAAKL